MTTFSTIKQALDKNPAILGGNYSLLGKTSRFGYKTYLSYDSKKGWEIVTLGIISRIFRKSFAIYYSTHLSHVHAFLRNEKFKLPENHSYTATEKKVKNFVDEHEELFIQKVIAKGKMPIDWRIYCRFVYN